jgi:hypothetical protein
MRRLLLLLSLSLSMIGCSKDPEDPPPDPVVEPEPDTEISKTSGRAQLRWKRYRTLQNDLAAALELAPDAVCTEVGGVPCATSGPVLLTDVLRVNGIDNAEAVCAYIQGRTTCADGALIELQTPKGLHVMSLGGNNPFLGEQFDPLAEPGLTTPVAVDRVVLSACGERVRLDVAGPARVFTSVDLSALTVRRDSAGVREQVTTLYRRILARDPEPAEVDALLSMLDGEPAMKATDFARLACYAIASSTEFIFQ